MRPRADRARAAHLGVAAQCGARPGAAAACLTLLTLFLTFDLVLFGAFTRSPIRAWAAPTGPAATATPAPPARGTRSRRAGRMPTGPVTHSKAWVEMVHRYLATGVGVLILTLAGAPGCCARQRGGCRCHPWWPAATLVWVCLQGAFGALTVTMKLFPAIVTLHLLGGMVLLALLCMQAVRYRQVAERRPLADPG
jgi:cytochrome c oxidase assembly protein subunit 15